MSDLAKQRVPCTKWRQNNPPLPEDHAIALGRVVAAWNIVESYCGTIIALALDISGELQHAVMAETPLLHRIDMIGAIMFAVRDQELFDHWRDLCTMLDSLRVKRNDLVHGEWWSLGYDQAIVRAKARGRVAVSQQTMPVSEMADLEEQIIAVVDQLGWFAHQVLHRRAEGRFNDPHLRPTIDSDRSPNARALDHARAAKRLRKAQARDRSRKPPG